MSLENHPPVDHPSPNRPTLIDTSRVSDVPPAQRDPLPDNNAPILAEPPPADPRVRFDEDPAISVIERTRNAWTNSPSGRAAGSQHEAPSQPANNPYDQSPSWYTPPHPPDIGANESQGTEPTPGGPIVSPRQGDCEGQARKLGTSRFDIVESGDVHNYMTRVMQLTRGRLLKQVDWLDWQDSEYLQLDQYDKQTMFGDPIAMDKDDAVFHLVWTYNVKALDGRKKA